MKKQKELFSIMSAQHDGLLDETSLKRLGELLEGDEEAQRYYLELGSLFHELEETFHGECAQTLVEEFPARRAKIVPMTTWAIACAASVAILLSFFSPANNHGGDAMLVDADSTILMDDTSFVIRVLSSDQVVWGAENSVEIRNDELKHGMLDLAEGSLDVVFDNGVRFGFEAPVKMDLSSLKRLALHSGSLAVNVPGLPEGLTIKTPGGVVVAHTALAQVDATSEGKTVVCVDSGAVDLFVENDRGKEIHRSLVGKETVALVQGAADPFVLRRMVTEPRIDLSQPAVLDDLKFAHYSFDDAGRERIENRGNIPNADGFLEGIAEFPEFTEPRKVPGRFGGALEFSGHGEGMLADLKDFKSDEPGSVAFWIKLDPETVPAPYETVFTWHMYTDPKKAWHSDDEKELACSIQINDKADRGVVGAVWIAFRDKWICGSKDLRDGRWHHVTAVFHRGYQGTVIRHYIDGELARSSARGKTWYPKARYEEIGGGSIAVGRVYWPKRPKILSPEQPVGLRGMVDELYVFNQAVLPSHASSLYMRNNPNELIDVAFVTHYKVSMAMLPLLPFSPLD